jgi:ankyrin repeat protein
MKVQAKFSEIAMLFIVIVLSIAANLSDHYDIGNIVSRKTMLIVLTATIVVALFHYLRLMLFVTIVTLAIGANLPDELATTLGISPLVMMVSLGLLISVSLVSYLFKLLPTGIEQPKINTVESRKSVLTAVTKGDLVNLHRLLKFNTEINFTQDGTMPVFIAAENGYADVMQILVHNGAKFRVLNAEGKTPMDIALTKGYTRIAEILNHAAESGFEKPV